MLSILGIAALIAPSVTPLLETAREALTGVAAENSNAPVSALVWWIIPIAALTGGLAYAYWITRLKSKYENKTERSVGRFKKFQESFYGEKIDRKDSDKDSDV
jgi:hypothetical protein